MKSEFVIMHIDDVKHMRDRIAELGARIHRLIEMLDGEKGLQFHKLASSEGWEFLDRVNHDIDGATEVEGERE